MLLTDRVPEPEHEEYDAGFDVSTSSSGANGIRRFPGGEYENVGDEELRDGSTCEVSPFVGRWNEGTDETANDHEFLADE